ncbi:hypothetical protein BKI52_12280 [marine bacterium AO1-C]|nr:hypothetical protein BKI52_12280 [marine bacterium AO1-C]
MTSCNDASDQSKNEEVLVKPKMTVAIKLQKLLVKAKKLTWPVNFTSQELWALASENAKPGEKYNFGYWVVNDDFIVFLSFIGYGLFYNIHLSTYDAHTGNAIADKLIGAVGGVYLGGTSYVHACTLSLKTKIDLIAKTKTTPSMKDDNDSGIMNRYCKINAKGLIQVKEL